MQLRLYSFLLIFKILFNKQFLFTNNYSTNHALINLFDLIKKYLDNKYYVFEIFINLQKTFDTENHNILLEKREYYGIPGLANHMQCSSSMNFRSFIVSSIH